MNNNNDIIFKKKNLKGNEIPKIHLLFENKVGNKYPVNFDENGWDSSFDNIEVFNSFYFSDHVYNFDLQNERSFNDNLSNESK